MTIGYGLLIPAKDHRELVRIANARTTEQKGSKSQQVMVKGADMAGVIAEFFGRLVLGIPGYPPATHGGGGDGHIDFRCKGHIFDAKGSMWDAWKPGIHLYTKLSVNGRPIVYPSGLIFLWYYVPRDLKHFPYFRAWLTIEELQAIGGKVALNPGYQPGLGVPGITDGVKTGHTWNELLDLLYGPGWDQPY